MVGDLDITYHIPGIREYIQNGGFKKDVPGLQEVIVMEGVAHFINQEKADEVSSHIYDFIKQFWLSIGIGNLRMRWYFELWLMVDL